MELLVVLGIIGIILASSVPALSGYATQVRLKTATREVVGLLSLARSLAISSHAPRTVVVDQEQGELFIEDPTEEVATHRVRLPSSVQLDVSSSDPQGMEAPRLTFQPSGALAGRSVSLILSNGKHTHTVVVTSVTGAVSVQ